MATGTVKWFLAISSGSPSRPSGTTLESIFRRSCPTGEEASSSLRPGVSIEPGLIAFTRTPGAASLRRFFCVLINCL